MCCIYCTIMLLSNVSWIASGSYCTNTILSDLHLHCTDLLLFRNATEGNLELMIVAAIFLCLLRLIVLMYFHPFDL